MISEDISLKICCYSTFFYFCKCLNPLGWDKEQRLSVCPGQFVSIPVGKKAVVSHALTRDDLPGSSFTPDGDHERHYLLNARHSYIVHFTSRIPNRMPINFQY